MPERDYPEEIRVFEKGKAYTVVGTMLKDGDQAPDFNLDLFNPTTQTICPISLKNLSPVSIIYTVNSFDSEVCRQEGLVWERDITGMLPEGITVYGASNDTVEFLVAWAMEDNITHPLLSSLKHPEFGKDWGISIKDNLGELQRGLFVVAGGKIAYAEYVKDQGGPLPDFNVALVMARAEVQLI